MSLDEVLWLLCLGAVFLLYYYNSRAWETIHNERQKYQELQTKHTKLKRTLATRGRRLDVLLSTVSEAVLRVDRLGRVLGGNELASNLFQFDKTAELPQSMLIFYRDSEWLSQYQHAIQALPEKSVLPEMNIQGRIFLPRLAPLGEKEALLLCMDITAYVQLQRKQQSLFENLMHDLKTPLTSLLGYARSIESFAEDVELRKEATTVIVKEAKHINDLMNSMLTLNQIGLEKKRGENFCDVIAITQQVWESLKVQMVNKNIKLQLLTSLPELKVAMSQADCHRILLNVADNAIKFSPEGSDINAVIEEQNGFAVIKIQDSGFGISETYLPRVTERFYRVDNVRGRKNEEGHGLGLAIVKETLERDGGKLLIENGESDGLLVTIQIPLKK